GADEGRRLELIDPGNAVWDTIGPERAMGGVVWSANHVSEPGVSEVAGAGSRYDLGERDGSASLRVQALAEAMQRGGLDTRVSLTIRNDVWRKLAGNLMAAPFAVLTQSRSYQFFGDPDCARAITRIAREVGDIAKAIGVT